MSRKYKTAAPTGKPGKERVSEKLSIKTYVQRDMRAPVTCPHCVARRTIKVSKAKIGRRFEAKCECGKVFLVQLEYREKFRKKVDFDAYFVLVDSCTSEDKKRWQREADPRLRKNCKVINISPHGLAIVPLQARKLEEGQDLFITFALDDSVKTILYKTATIRNTKENLVSCEFVDEDKDDQAIGFFVLSG